MFKYFSQLLRELKSKPNITSLRFCKVEKTTSVRVPFKIRTAGKDDVPGIEALRRQFVKESTPKEIAIWMDHDPKGIKVAETEKGDIIGVCNAIVQHENLCVLGTYIVDEKFQELGIGIQLWNSCMEYVGSRPAVLNGVLDKIDLYMKDGGFPIKEEDWTCVGYYTEEIVDPSVLSKDLPAGVHIRPFQESHLPLIYRYDYELMGFERNLALNQSCQADAECRTLVAVLDGDCVGFGVIRLTFDGVRHLGPLYANDSLTAETLLRRLIELFPSAKGLSMACVSKNSPANEFLKKLKCTEFEELVRLYKERKINQVDVQKVFALFNTSFTLF